MGTDLKGVLTFGEIISVALQMLLLYLLFHTSSAGVSESFKGWGESMILTWAGPESVLMERTVKSSS